MIKLQKYRRIDRTKMHLRIIAQFLSVMIWVTKMFLSQNVKYYECVWLSLFISQDVGFGVAIFVVVYSPNCSGRMQLFSHFEHLKTKHTLVPKTSHVNISSHWQQICIYLIYFFSIYFGKILLWANK